MPPFFDMSSAYSWLLIGFLAGLLVYWLVRALLGLDRKRLDEIDGLRAELNQARSAQSSFADMQSRLEGERARLLSEVNQLSPRASLLPQLERQLAEAKQAAINSTSALETANQQISAQRDATAAELAQLRRDVEAKAKTAAQYEAEYGRLHAAHQQLTSDLGTKTNLIAKLQSDFEAANRGSDEAVRLRSENASARAQVKSLQADLKARTSTEQMYKEEISRLTIDFDGKRKALEAKLAERDHELKTARANMSGNADLANEVARLQSALAAAPKQDLSGEVARLQAALSAAPKEDLTGEVGRLRAEIARLAPAEAARAELASEVARLKGEIAALPRQDLTGEVSRLTALADKAQAAERQAALELHATRNDLSQVRMGLEEMSRLLAERNAETEQLRARLANMPDVENYRRFKEALDAANRIAAGLPEKS